jgi:hypothetical protein
MPSDDRTARALAALARPRDTFHSALVEAVTSLRAFIAEQRAPQRSRAAHESARLGEFAAATFDAARFSQLVGAADAMDAARLERLEHALAVLASFADQGDELYRVRVEPGGDLRDTVRSALAARGRVFNATHQVELLRTGRLPATASTDDGLAFPQWSRLEKSIAPPLLVEVSGANLQVCGLAEYLDGAQKIVLVVDGPAAPAPLARLIAPQTFVMQTVDPDGVRQLADFDGAGIAAVMAEGSAEFVHDPSAGSTLARRLRTGTVPEAPARGIAGGSVRRQAEELAWLKELAAYASAAASAAAAAPGEDQADEGAEPADRLAGWLLTFGTEGDQ